MLDFTDVIAVLLLVMASLRRLDVKLADPERSPAVPREAFESWRARALGVYRLTAGACFLKFTLSNIWLFLARDRVIPPVLATGGALVFIGWVIALMIAWRRGTAARQLQQRLGIVVGRAASAS